MGTEPQSSGPPRGALSRPGHGMAWAGTGLVLATLVVGYVFSRLGLSPARVELPVLGEVSDFTLTNQDGAAVTLADFRGRAWVADIIFTRCAGPCPEMTRRMRQIQRALPAHSGARLVTLTTDPDYDSPPVLKSYAQRHEADTRNWAFLTGTKRQIAALATGSLRLTAVEIKPEERESPADLFIHSTVFVVVDKHSRLRGIFETTGPGVDAEKVIPDIVGAVRRLERER